MRKIIIAAAFAVMTAASVYAGEDPCRCPTHAGYLFSARPEFMLVHDEIYSLGGIAEAGVIFKNGLLLSANFGGGVHYAGTGLNVGYFFGRKEAGVKSALGYSLGYYHTDIAVNFESKSSGELLKRYYGKDVGVAGLFWKLMAGNSGGHHADFTARVMTGYESGSVWYNEADGIYTKHDFNVSYSVSLGYTFVKRRR